MNPLSQIINYLELSDLIGTAGQPTREQFADVARAGYEVVINLARPDSSSFLADEAQLATGLGMEYIGIPVVWDHPRMDDLRRFYTALDENPGRKLFVHCAMNMRVSAFFYIYRVRRQGVAVEEARKLMEHIWTPNETWAAFIEKALDDPAFW